MIKLPDSFSKMWTDNFLISTLNGNHLLRIKFDKNYNKIIYNEKIFIGERIRDLKYDTKNEKIILALTSTGSLGILSNNSIGFGPNISILPFEELQFIYINS